MAKFTDAAEVVAQIQQRPQGTYLDLSNKSLKDEDMGVVAEGIQQARPATINLNNNRIQSSGMRILARTLQHCTELKGLHLSDNRVGDDGLCILAALLPSLPGLRVVKVARNNASRVGGIALLRALRNCPHITTLTFDENGGREVMEQIVAQLKKPLAERVLEEAVRSLNAADQRSPLHALEAANQLRGLLGEAPLATPPAAAAERHEESRRSRYARLAAAANVDSAPKLVCPVCVEPLDRSTVALLQSCLHPVHARCADLQLQKSSAIDCPVCMVPSTATVRPPPEHGLLNRADSAASRCAECDPDMSEADAQAAFACDGCNYPVCDAHAILHRRSPNTSHHILIALGMTLSAEQTCKAHGAPLKAYCVPCQQAVCAVCLAPPTNHPVGTHRRVLLDGNHMRAALLRVGAGLATAEAMAVKHRARLAAAQIACVDIAERDTGIHGEITAAFDVLRALLYERERVLHRELDDRSGTEQRELDKAATIDEERWQATTSARTAFAVTERLVVPTGKVDGAGATTAANAVVLAQTEPAATAQLQGLVASVGPVAPVPVPVRLRFHIMEDAVQKALQTLGELQVVGRR